MYSDVVLGVEHHHFEEILEEHKERNGYTLDTDLTADDWSELVDALQEARRGGDSGTPFPQDPHDQLWGAIGAVFGSWMNQRANDLSPAAQHSGKLGHRGQRAGHGVRQYGRHVGDRRCLHAQSVDRREASSTANS